jgi:hypothetical protein
MFGWGANLQRAVSLEGFKSSDGNSSCCFNCNTKEDAFKVGIICLGYINFNLIEFRKIILRVGCTATGYVSNRHVFEGFLQQ